jgi:hypothetical protein
MYVVLKTVFVKRLGGASPPVYSVAVEDLEPILVKEVLLGHVLGLLLGTEAGDALKIVIYGPTGEFEARVWINATQASALQVLMTQYGVVSE